MMTNTLGGIWLQWSDVFTLSLQNLWVGFVEWAPKLILAILLFIIGWVVGSLVAKAFVQVIGALKIDKLFASVGAEDLFRKMGMNLNTGYFVGQLAKWFIVIVFLLSSLNLVGLDSIADFLRTDVLAFLPRVVIAVFILVIATVVSEALSKTIIAGTKAMNLHSAHMLGTIAKYAVWIFAFIIVLGELGVAAYYMSVLFTGIIAMISLGGALAFGLGGKDHASRFLSKLSEESHR